MKEAFTYMFKDPGYSKKAAVYFVICFISLALMAIPEVANPASVGGPLAQGPKVTPVTNPLFIFLPLIGLAFNSILCGYYFTCVQAVTNQQNNIVLPFMNVWNSFIKGLKFIIAIFLIILLLFVLFIPFALSGKITTAIYEVFLSVFIILGMNGFIWLFSNEGKISTFFALKKLFKLIKQNAKSYFRNWFVSVLLIAGGAIISTMFMLLFNFLINNIYTAWIATSIEGALIASYTAFAGMYLIAKSIRPDSVV